jgi:hypothetical protein
LSGVITIWMGYLLAAVVASGIVIAVGWRSRRARGLADPRGRRTGSNDPLWNDPLWNDPPWGDPPWGDPEIDAGASDAPADVAAAIRLALKRMAAVLADQSVKVDVAAPSGLLARMRGAALADLLEALLATAIQGATASRLLLTAATHGDRIHVSITDDVPGADPAMRAASVRDLMERVALRGGAMDINVRPAEGTTMTLRFAAATGVRQDRASAQPNQGLPEPASGATLL